MNRCETAAVLSLFKGIPFPKEEGNEEEKKEEEEEEKRKSNGWKIFIPSVAIFHPPSPSKEKEKYSRVNSIV